MGSTLSRRLDSAELAKVKNATAFSRDEILELYAQFRFLSGGKERITRKQFVAALEGTGVRDANVLRMVESLHATFDKDGDGLNFREFCAGLSVFATNNLDETIHTLFNMYNAAGDDVITFDEMVQSTMAVASALELPDLSTTTSDPAAEREAKVTEWVKGVFAKHDTNNDGMLNINEFSAAMHEHPLLAEMGQRLVKDVCSDFFHMPSGRMEPAPVPLTDKTITNQANYKVQLTYYDTPECDLSLLTMARLVEGRKNCSVLGFQVSTSAEPMDAYNRIPEVTKVYTQKIDAKAKAEDVADHILRYADANHADVVGLGLYQRRLESIPWHVVQKFDGLATVIGHVDPSLRSLCAVVCVDESACGKHAACFAGSFLRASDTALILALWHPPGMSSVGDACFASNDEWSHFIRKRKVQAAKVAEKCAKKCLTASNGVLNEENVKALVSQETNDWETALAAVMRMRRVDMLIVGMQSNKSAKRLYDLVQDVETLNCIVVVN